MEQSQAGASVAGDVLHFESQSKLSAEEIAKAIAHHKKHHHEQQGAPTAQGKKQPGKRGK